MIKRLYNYELLPEISEEAKKYPVNIVYGSGLWACNELWVGRSSISKFLLPYDGVVYSPRQGKWELSRTYYGESSDHALTYWSLTGDISEIWTNRSLVDDYGNIVFHQSAAPGTVEYGFWDGGEGDALSITEFTVPQGFHVTGTWKCIVSGTDSPVAKMEWYRNKVLISTETGKSESECKPSADTIGTFTYHCVITFENGKSVTAGDMTMTVEAYDPGEDPGGGGDNPGGGGGGGDDETSLVTGIDLYVYPDTVVPGGHATIEVSVNGIGNYSKAFTARMSGHASSETELFSAGYSCNVWVAEEETAEYVLVTVTSVQDPNITATEMLYIDHTGTEEEGTTQEQLQKAFWKGFAAAKGYFQEAKVSVSASIHIARAEAEPTTKAGKLQRSFWQGFVSGLFVTADTLPDWALVSSDGFALKDSNGLYLCAEGLPATGYLYNGVQLPPLPDWDKEAYPYAFIFPFNIFGTLYYELYFAKEIMYWQSSSGYCIGVVDSLSYHCFPHFEEPSWESSSPYGDALIGAAENVAWANFPVRGENGAVIMLSKKPVPVYE